MGDETDKKFTWVIKDFSTLKSEQILYSKMFVGRGCKWRLKAFPKGNNLETLSQRKESVHWFAKKEPSCGFASMIPLTDIHAKGSGFLLNGELIIVANIDVLEVIGELDVPEETSPADVNGFQLLPSQVKSVKRLLERYPENASKFRKKNPLMKSAYMNLVLSLIETLGQSPQQITNDDMSDAYATLEFVNNAGFRLDWLKDKLDEVSEKKEKLEACETRVKKLEGELNDLKHKCSDVEAQLEKEKAELSAFKAPLSDVEALLKEKD